MYPSIVRRGDPALLRNVTTQPLCSEAGSLARELAQQSRVAPSAKGEIRFREKGRRLSDRATWRGRLRGSFRVPSWESTASRTCASRLARTYLYAGQIEARA